MKSWTLTTLLILMMRTSAAATCPTPQSSELVGLWESEDKSRGGIGHAIELRADGSYGEATTVLVDMYYRVSGDRILLSEKPGGGGEESPLPYRFEEDLLIQEQQGTVVARKERIGQREPGQDPLVGVWRYDHPTGPVAYERYSPDGRMQLRLPMRSSQGCFLSRDGKLTLTQTGKTMTGSAKLRDDRLRLSFPGKSTAEYRKVPEGPWYGIEKQP